MIFISRILSIVNLPLDNEATDWITNMIWRTMWKLFETIGENDIDRVYRLGQKTPAHSFYNISLWEKQGY